MASAASRSRSTTNSGRACSRPPTSCANSLKKTNPSSSSKDNNFDREQYLYLTTRGRKTGLPREIEIWFTHREGRFYVIAEYPTSRWVQNLRADHKTQVRVGGQSFTAHARFVTREAEP